MQDFFKRYHYVVIDLAHVRDFHKGQVTTCTQKMDEERQCSLRSLLERAAFPSTSRAHYKPIDDIRHHKEEQFFPAASNCLALIATCNYLPFAKLVAQSFLEFHADFDVFLLLVDGDENDKSTFHEGHVVLLSDLKINNVGWYVTKLDAAEFSNALKPVFLTFLSKYAEKAIYLDCDIAVFSKLTEMINFLDAKDLVLVPHMLKLPPHPERFWMHPTRSDIFNSGLINAGCFGIRLDRTADFLTFWEEANFAPGAFYHGAGYQTDQQYLNWALITLPGTHVLRERRYNVAYWNLHDRNLRIEPGVNGEFQMMVDEETLGLYHFSGYDIHDRLKISVHDERHSVYLLPAVAHLLNWYSDRILACSAASRLYQLYRFDEIANGFRVTKFIREILKKYEIYFPKFDTMTVAGADAFCTFLMEPLAASGSMLPLISAEIYARRPDLQDAFPDAHTSIQPLGYWRWFCRHAGSEYNVQILIDCFRRTLVSNSVYGFAEQVKDLLDDEELEFLGSARTDAAERLRKRGSNGVADALLEARNEWYAASDIAVALTIYEGRPDLHEKYPDILNRDHNAFCGWLELHAPGEHGCPITISDSFRRCTADATLARIYSYLSRREDVASVHQSSLLSDDLNLTLRHMISASGEGLEFCLDDVIMLKYIHHSRRHLLIPLFLELPLVRSQAHASRLREASATALPEEIRIQQWALSGCELHSSYFDRFEALLDDEVHRWAAGLRSPHRNVIDYLRGQQGEQAAIKMIEPLYYAAARRFSSQKAVLQELSSSLKEKQCHPSVNIFGYFKSDIGIGESSRGLAAAVSFLRPVNCVPVCTAQLQDGIPLSSLFQRYEHVSDTNIIVSYPHQNEDVLAMIRPEYRVGRRNVVHLAWEQKDGNPLWQNVYDRYDEIWAISDFAATSFRKMFPGRVRVVPNALDFEQLSPFELDRSVSSDKDQVQFLFVFDANSSLERKNPEGVIDAFILAFKDSRHKRRVSLTLKVCGMHRAEHTSRVERLFHKARDSGLSIKFDGRQLPREDILRMIAAADCYISLHRAEGFGYTMAEAMFYGVPVIASGYSGNLEYMTSSDSFLVPCHEAFVKIADGPFQCGSVWGEPDLEVAVSLLRHVVERPADAEAIGQRGRKAVRNKLSTLTISESMHSFFSFGQVGRDFSIHDPAGD